MLALLAVGDLCPGGMDLRLIHIILTFRIGNIFKHKFISFSTDFIIS